MMNRRDFLRISAGLLAVPWLPAVRATAETDCGGWVSIDAAQRAIDLLKANGAKWQWTIITHSSVADDLMAPWTPKEKWKFAYRQEKMAIREMMGGVLASGEIGRCENIRFVMSPTLT